MERTSKPKNSKQRTSKPKISGTTAPYNFVPLSETVYQRYTHKKELPKHNKIYRGEEERLSGEITCSIEAVTDIAIGGSKNGEFYKDTQGNFAIPGSSLRGLIRTNMQILGACAVGDDMEDFRYMYRKVGESGTPLSGTYKRLLNIGQITGDNKEKITVCKNIRAGYIKNEGGKYFLYNNVKTQSVNVGKGKLDYYPIRETEIFRNKDKYGKNDYDFFFNKYSPKLQYKGSYDDFKVEYRGKCKCCNTVFNLSEDDLKLKGINKFNQTFKFTCKNYEANNKKNCNCDRNVTLKKHIEGKVNELYVPYCKEISYKLDKDKIQAIGNPDDFCKKGYVLSSGHMKEKKVIYIIPKIDEQIHQLSEDDIQTYKRDFENKKKRLGTTGFHNMKAEDKKELCKNYEEFFQLPKEGEQKPVFFICVDGKYYFGYTQFLRVYFKHSIKHGLPKAHNKFVYDYAKSIFGYSNNNVEQGQEESYKGRVYFEDASLSPDSAKVQGKLNRMKLTLESPKASDYFDYLQQEGYDSTDSNNVMSYEDDNFEIRGIKQYWFKEPKMPKESKEIKDMSEFSYIKKGACFEAKVRFKNLTEDELGLLLWCIRLEEKSQLNIGKAKAYGYGRIGINNMEVKMFDLKKMYNLDCLDFNPIHICKQDEIEQYMKGYKAKIEDIYKADDKYRASRDAFFGMKNSEKIPKEENTEYMSLKEYNNNKRSPLPTPQTLMG